MLCSACVYCHVHSHGPLSVRLQEQLQVVPQYLVSVKYMTFSDIHKLIQQKFPTESISTVEASRIIKEAFPWKSGI